MAGPVASARSTTSSPSCARQPGRSEATRSSTPPSSRHASMPSARRRAGSTSLASPRSKPSSTQRPTRPTKRRPRNSCGSWVGRKKELGRRFFAPRILRSIVAYNAALTRRIERGLWDSRDWGSLPGLAGEETRAASVFDAEALPRLADALSRRAEGMSPSTSAIDRIAWCVDLERLTAGERETLAAPDVGTRGNLRRHGDPGRPPVPIGRGPRSGSCRGSESRRNS